MFSQKQDEPSSGQNAGFGKMKFDGAQLFDSVAQIMTDALGLAEGAKREVETIVRTQLERLILAMNVATREELDVLRDQIAALQADNAALKARLDGAPASEASAEKPAEKPTDSDDTPDVMLPNA